MLSINTNMSAINALNTINRINKDMLTTQQRLATGKKINSAADNPAGLVIVKQLESQLAGVTQAIDNTKTAVSLVKAAESAHDEMNKLLEKAKKLTLSNLDAATSAEAKVANQTELNNIVDSIERIADNTKFGTTKLLDGTFTGKNFQIGGNAGETVSLDITDMQTANLGTGGGGGLGNLAAVKGLDSTSADYNDVLGVLDDAINDVTTQRGALGAFQTNTLESNLNSLVVTKEQLTASKSVIEDADMAEESVQLNKQLAQYQLALMTLQQSNQRSGQILSLFG
jgi:flagellin